MKNFVEQMEIGKVYKGEFIRSQDIPSEKVIATQFKISEDLQPIQIFSYAKNKSRNEMLQWYQGKYSRPLDYSDELVGSYWWIWKNPDRPEFLEVIRRSVKMQSFDNSNIDQWGFPIRQDDVIPFQEANNEIQQKRNYQQH